MTRLSPYFLYCLRTTYTCYFLPASQPSQSESKRYTTTQPPHLLRTAFVYITFNPYIFCLLVSVRTTVLLYSAHIYFAAFVCIQQYINFAPYILYGTKYLLASQAEVNANGRLLLSPNLIHCLRVQHIRNFAPCLHFLPS